MAFDSLSINFPANIIPSCILINHDVVVSCIGNYEIMFKFFLIGCVIALFFKSGGGGDSDCESDYDCDCSDR